MSAILCRLYSTNLVWRITEPLHLDGLFYEAHARVCPDMKPEEGV